MQRKVQHLAYPYYEHIICPFVYFQRCTRKRPSFEVYRVIYICKSLQKFEKFEILLFALVRRALAQTPLQNISRAELLQRLLMSTNYYYYYILR